MSQWILSVFRFPPQRFAFHRKKGKTNVRRARNFLTTNRSLIIFVLVLIFPVKRKLFRILRSSRFVASVDRSSYPTRELVPLHSGTNLQNRSAAYLNSGNSRDFDACLPSFHLQSLHTFATAHNCRCKQFQEGPNARLTSCSTCANRGCSRCYGDFCKIPRVPRITPPLESPFFLPSFRPTHR